MSGSVAVQRRRSARAAGALWAGLALAGCAAGTGDGVPGPGAASVGDPRVEIVQVTGRLFSAVRTRDTSLLRTLFLPDAVLVAVGRSTVGESVRAKTVDRFLRTVAGREDAMLERLRRPATRVDGDLAIVSGSYDAYAGNQYSHCGHDIFHLVRRGGAWRIAVVTYTIALGPCA